jgi:hypothetical protein
MKNFKKFLEEVTIKGNPGVPDDYLSDMEKSKSHLMGENPMNIGKEMHQLMMESFGITKGKESDLEKLAEEVIRENFGDILEDVDLDIKLVKGGIKSFMDEESDETPEFPKIEFIKDKDLINKIHKGKLGNVITQGEAKNTKNILNLPDVRDKVKGLFGEEKGTRLIWIWNRLTILADKMDWIIPIEVKADMFKIAPEGIGGAVKVDWKPKEFKLDDESEYEGDDEGDDDYSESFTPIIKARGIDFPMLLHETVKGIYELVASISIPKVGSSQKEIDDANTVKINISSPLDEAEDFRTGPQIAADFRDFINQNPDSNYTQNMRAYIFGMMMDSSYMSDSEFLELFRGILNKTRAARQKIDTMISEVISKLKSYDSDMSIEYSDDVDEYDDIYNNISDEDPSKLSKRELNDLIDIALDNGDFKEVERLSKYLKESKNFRYKKRRI